MKKEFILISLLFLIISVFVISGIIFNDQLIGRSLDFNVTPVSYLAKNTYLMDFYTWWGTMNGGGRNSFGAALIPINTILFFPALFHLGQWFITRYQIILTLFLAMLFFYLLSKRLLEDCELEKNYKTALSITGALFFTLNNYFFNELIFGSNAQYLTFSFIPLLIYSIISYFKYQKRAYFWLSLFSIIVVSSTLQHLVAAYILLFLLSLIYKNYKFLIKLGFLHFLLGFYWIAPLLYVAQEVKTTEVLLVDYSSSLKGSAPKFVDILVNKEYVFGRNSYNLALNSVFLSSIWFLNAFLLLIVSLFCLLKLYIFKDRHKKIILGFSSLFFLSVLFIKGANKPFGELILYLYNTFPLFSLFRSLQHYISFYVIAISVLFIFSGFYLIKANKKSLYFLILLVFINAMPWWYTFDLGTKNIASSNLIPSYFNQFYLTEGDKKMYELNKLPLNFGIMHLPPGYSINFLAVGKNEFNFITRDDLKIKSQGTDTGLYYGNKKFYATDAYPSNLTKILDKLEKDMYTEPDFFNKNNNLFALLNVGYFVLREDVTPNFSKSRGLLNINNIKEAIDKSHIFSSVETEGFITVMKTKDFLPQLYVPESIIKTDRLTEKLSEIVSGGDYPYNLAVYFDEQNINVKKNLKSVPDKVKKLPFIEFRKINPTKYKVVVRKASDDFPLIFSESFHPAWKAYVVKNEFDYIKKHKADFISENFHGTIQNNNLPKGNILDTWFKEPLPEDKHLIANAYANSWIINPIELCKSKNCINNIDGTYDFEMIIEFWPQRLLHLGFFISGVTLLVIINFLVFTRKKVKES